MVANNLVSISTLVQFPSSNLDYRLESSNSATEDLEKTLVTGQNPASFDKIVCNWQDLGIASGCS